MTTRKCSEAFAYDKSDKIIHMINVYSHRKQKALRLDGGVFWWTVEQLTNWVLIRRSSVVDVETLLVHRASAWTNCQDVPFVGGSGSVEPTETFVCRCMYHLELMCALPSDERTAVDDKKEPRDVRRRHDVSGRRLQSVWTSRDQRSVTPSMATLDGWRRSIVCSDLQRCWVPASKYFIYAYLCIPWRHRQCAILGALLLTILCCYRCGKILCSI